MSDAGTVRGALPRHERVEFPSTMSTFRMLSVDAAYEKVCKLFNLANRKLRNDTRSYGIIRDHTYEIISYWLHWHPPEPRSGRFTRHGCLQRPV